MLKLSLRVVVLLLRDLQFTVLGLLSSIQILNGAMVGGDLPSGGILLLSDLLKFGAGLLLRLITGNLLKSLLLSLKEG